MEPALRSSGMGDKRERNSDWEVFHEEKNFLVNGVLARVSGAGGKHWRAGLKTPTQFSGVIDAYTPQTGSTGPVMRSTAHGLCS